MRRGLVRSEAGDYARAIEDFSGASRPWRSAGRHLLPPGASPCRAPRVRRGHRGLQRGACVEPDLAEAYLNRGLARAARPDAASRRAAIEDLKSMRCHATGEDRTEVERILSKLEKQR